MIKTHNHKVNQPKSRKAVSTHRRKNAVLLSRASRTYLLLFVRFYDVGNKEHGKRVATA